MAASIAFSGNAAPVVGTILTLQDVTTAGTYALHVDLSNMAAGDVVTLRVRNRANASSGALGASTSVAYQTTFSNAQVLTLSVSPPILVPLGARFELLQSAGTARTFQWAVVSP